MRKRGLSTIVTSLIMILLVLVAVGVVWAVVRNTLKSSVEDINIEKFSIRLNIESVKVNGDVLDITLKRDPGKGEITSIKFVLKNETNSVIVVKNTSLSELELKTFIINTTQEGITLPLTEISMYAITKTSAGKEVPGTEYNYKISSSSSSSTGGGGCTSSTFYNDTDNDNYGNLTSTISACTAPSGYVTNNTDCNDADNNVWQLLNGYIDSDNDNYGTGTQQDLCSGASLPIGYSSTNTDCNDSDLNINPGTTEICNLIDDDCDGSIDEGGVCVTFLKTWPGFVSWWRFEGNANDEISGNIGIVNGGATPATGKYGQAYQFDGVDDYVTINNINLINNTGNTFIAWVKPNGTQDNLDVISLQVGSFGLRMSSANKIEYYVFNKTTSFVSFISNSALTSNNWSLIAGVYNFGGDNITFYLNGNHDNSRASIGGLRSNNGFDGDIDGFQVGGGQANRYLKGFIDEVMIWNRSLSASEIQQIYNMNLSLG